MLPVYAVHIAAGSLSLILGFTALYATKGARLHRRSGMLFAYTMLTMCAFGFVMALGKTWAPVNVSAAMMTGYLVITSLTTVKPPAEDSPARWLPVPLMLAAFGIGVFDLNFALAAVANGGQTEAGIPAFPFFLFGTIGIVAGIGDLRVVRVGELTGASRLARHLWRMTFALFVATMSFFLGQAKVIPKPIRIFPLLALPVLAVLVTLLYWMWRVKIKRSVRGLVVGMTSGASRPVLPGGVGAAL